MKKTNLVTNVELIDYAKEIGYEHNQACHIIESKELMLHVWELGQKDYDIKDFSGSKFNADINKICGGFMKENQIESMTLINE